MKAEILNIAKKLETNDLTINGARNLLMELFRVNDICSCGVKYVETKKSDIAYDTDDNVYYTDIIIHHCPKCGDIYKIDEY